MKSVRNRLLVILGLIPYFVGSWIIYDRLGKMIAVAISLMFIGALLAFQAELKSKIKPDSKDADKD